MTRFPLGAALLALAGCGGRTQNTDATAPPDAATADVAPEAAPDVQDFRPCQIELAPNASIRGTTPQGSFDARYARLAKAEGECPSSILLVFTETPELEVTLSFARTKGPELRAYRTGSFRNGIALGALEANLVFTDEGGRQVDIPGKLDLTAAEFPDEMRNPNARAEGSVTVGTGAEGFALQGNFVAPYCALLDILCP